MELYFYFNETTGDLVYSDKATYSGSGYTSLGQQTKTGPFSLSDWVFNSQRSTIVTVSKDESTVGKIAGLTRMYNMFKDCSNLTSLDLSGFDTSAVTNMYGTFFSCTNLTSLDLSGFDTSAVKDMSYMFYGCSGLISLDLSNFDTLAVKDMSNMFDGCSGLISLDLSNFDTSSVTNMGYMFYDCNSIVGLNLSGFDTSNVIRMDNMFYGCNNIASLDLSGFDTSAVKNMTNMFRSCSNLTSLDLSCFDTSAKPSMNSIFKDCTSLTSLDLSGFDMSFATDMNDTYDMFDACDSLRIITIGDKMSNALSRLPADQYYPAAGGEPVAKANLTAGTWVRDEADLTKVTSLVQQAQMSQAISRRISSVRYDLNSIKGHVDRLKNSFEIVLDGYNSSSDLITLFPMGAGDVAVAQVECQVSIPHLRMYANKISDYYFQGVMRPLYFETGEDHQYIDVTISSGAYINDGRPYAVSLELYDAYNKVPSELDNAEEAAQLHCFSPILLPTNGMFGGYANIYYLAAAQAFFVYAYMPEVYSSSAAGGSHNKFRIELMY